MTITRYFLAVIIIFLSAQINTAIAKDTGVQAAEPKESITVCQKPVKTRGPGNLLSSVAELKTIIIWSELVKKKFGPDHASWHFAKDKSLKCKKANGSNYYYCEIRARGGQKTLFCAG